MDGIQAAVLNVKLKHIDRWTKMRINNASYYNEVLDGIDGISIPTISDLSSHVYHLYVIRVDDRKKIINYLSENNIDTGIHYPTPLPFLNAYKYLNHKPEDFPISWDYKDKILSLPMYPELTTEMIDYIADHLKKIQT